MDLDTNQTVNGVKQFNNGLRTSQDPTGHYLIIKDGCLYWVANLNGTYTEGDFRLILKPDTNKMTFERFTIGAWRKAIPDGCVSDGTVRD